MSENFTQVEWDGLLRGKAMPGDIFVGEQMSSYLHRKFQALLDANEQLKRDAERYRLVRESAYSAATIEGHRLFVEFAFPMVTLPNTADYFDAAVDAELEVSS